MNILISLSYDKKKYISWRAIEAIGLVSKEIAESDTETVRNIVGRLLWMIRDESGGIGWSVPETLGEIVRNNRGLCADIAPIIASFHDEKMLTAGVLWAMGRIGNINDQTSGYAIPLILPYLQASDHVLRAYAAFALGRIGAVGAVPKLEQIRNDNSAVTYYEDGDLRQKTVGAFAEEALEELKIT
ncbi:MAG: DVU0298 family protein, partial [Nitrospirota bacterium]